MKRLKLFPKTFLYTLILIVFIVGVALGTTYLLGRNLVGGSLSVTLRDTNSSMSVVGDFTPAESVQPDPSPEQTPEAIRAEEENAEFLQAAEDNPDFTLVEEEEMGTVAYTIIKASTQIAIPAATLAPNQAMKVDTIAMDAVPFTSYSVATFGNLVGSAIAKAIPVVAVVCLVLAVVCALLFSRLIAKPVREISAATEGMERLEPDARCPSRGQDEIAALAERVNTLYDSLLTNIRSLEEEKARVEESEKSKVDFLRSASHELKTPVTAMSAMLENMILGVGKYKDYDVYLPRCKEMSDRLGDMIREILDASRTQNAAADEVREEVELGPYLAELWEPYAAAAKGAGQTVGFEIEEGARAQLPPKLFGRVISNLMSNAVSYTPPGGEIKMSVRAGVLTVENQCSPIPEADLAHIFEPFYRPDWARNRADGGNGLGLYIAASVLDTLKLPYSFLPKEGGMVFIIVLESGENSISTS